MKHLVLGLAAAAAVAGPIAAGATAAYAQPRGYYDRWDRRDDRRDNRWDRRDDRRDYRRDRRDDRRYSHWDRGRHNGYYYNNRWYYGPPPAAYYGSPYYRPGYTAWRRGAYMPPYYREYVIYDYDRYRLRRPPPGYAWHRVGSDYLLVALATGLILEIINN